MPDGICPYCKEEIKKDAIICKHCKKRTKITRMEMAGQIIKQRLEFEVPKPSGSPCEAGCFATFKHDKRQLQECLDDCKAIYLWKLLVEKLHRELDLSMYDIIWGGGDIDPVPFEKEVRERFSKPMDPRGR